VPVNAAINSSPGGTAAAATATTGASWSPAVCEGGWRGGGRAVRPQKHGVARRGARTILAAQGRIAWTTCGHAPKALC
jgi:hypothetical protein